MEETRGLYIVVCTWYLVLPFIYTPISNVIPEPPPPAPTPTPPPPSFASYDSDGDDIAIREECESRCYTYSYIRFKFEDDAPGVRQCREPYQTVLYFNDGEYGEYLKNPYFVSLELHESEFWFTAKVKEFTNLETWKHMENYDLTVVCYE
jgi:hypothetical protein